MSASDFPLVKTVPLAHIRKERGIPDPEYFKKNEATAKKAEGPAQQVIKKEKQ